jgi:plastocyanin
MNKTLIIVIAIVIIAGGAYFFMPKNSISPTTPPPPSGETVTPPPSGTSEVLPPSPSTSQEIVIMMNNSAYAPDKVTIKKGDTVKFVNAASEDRWPASNIHPTHQIYPEFDPKRPVGPGQSWSFTFDKVGAWRCHDHLDPSISCTITVEE